jgi:tRNA-(ms[2]io[6]A)-hydroxylase
VAERRRLPVIQNAPSPRTGQDGQDDEQRPPAHWVGFGVVAIFAAWLPLTYVAGAVSSRVLASRFGADASHDAINLAMNAMSSGERARLMAVVALPGVLALALAAFGGGFVIGRFGSGTGSRESASAGAVTAVIATVMAWAGVTTSSVLAGVVTLAVAVSCAAWGGRVGARRRA